MTPKQFLRAYFAALPEPGAKQIEAQRQRLLARSHSPRSVAFRLAAAAAVLCGLIALALSLSGPSRLELSARLDSRPAPVGSPISAEPAQRRVLEFSDGSRVHLEPSTALSILALAPGIAELRLEQGSIDVSVEKHTGVSWTIHAGPYAVRVVGTKFSVTWHPSFPSFRVDVREGQVRVSGGSLEPEGVLLGPGRSLQQGVPGRSVDTHPESNAPAALAGAEPEVAQAPTGEPRSGATAVVSSARSALAVARHPLEPGGQPDERDAVEPEAVPHLRERLMRRDESKQSSSQRPRVATRGPEPPQPAAQPTPSRS